MNTKPVCLTVLPWLKANLGKHCLGCLTGQSARALAAAVQLVALYSYCDSESEANVLQAFRNTVYAMPPEQRHLAYHAIAHVMNWSDRARIWAAAGIEPIENPRRCAFES